MTRWTCEFITPLTLSTISKKEVIVNIFPISKVSGTKHSTWHSTGSMVDLMIAAPATINRIAKIANAFADNELITLVTALRCNNHSACCRC